MDKLQYVFAVMAVLSGIAYFVLSRNMGDDDDDDDGEFVFC